MPRGVLGSYPADVVNVLTLQSGPPDALGQSVKSWQPGPNLNANVQPLGSEAAQRMGLTADRERWRVRLPRGTALPLSGRLRMRGRDWTVIRVEAWKSFHLVIVEGVI